MLAASSCFQKSFLEVSCSIRQQLKHFQYTKVQFISTMPSILPRAECRFSGNSVGVRLSENQPKGEVSGTVCRSICQVEFACVDFLHRETQNIIITVELMLLVAFACMRVVVLSINTEGEGGCRVGSF